MIQLTDMFEDRFKPLSSNLNCVWHYLPIYIYHSHIPYNPAPLCLHPWYIQDISLVYGLLPSISRCCTLLHVAGPANLAHVIQGAQRVQRFQRWIVWWWNNLDRNIIMWWYITWISDYTDGSYFGYMMEGLHPIICIQESNRWSWNVLKVHLREGTELQVKMQVILCSKTLRITFKKSILAG